MRIYEYEWLIIWHLKNIRKYVPLYFKNSEIEIHSGEEFVFSITYRDPEEFEFAENIPISRH